MEEPDEGQRRRQGRLEWERHKPLLYDQFSQQRFTSPPITVDFLPGWCRRDGGWAHQQLVTACHNEDGDLQLQFLQIPVLRDPFVAEPTPLRIERAVFDMPELTDILRVRHMPQVPSLLAVKAPEGVLLVRSPQADYSIENQDDDEPVTTPNIQGGQIDYITGDETEADADEEDDYVAWVIGTLGGQPETLPEPKEMGLAWSPGSIGSLLSTSADGSITLYRVDVDDSQVDAAAPSHLEASARVGQAEVFSQAHGARANDVAWVPNEGPGAPHTFSSVGEEGKLCCWDLRAGRSPVGSCFVHYGAANTLTYSNHDPYTLVTGGADGHLSVLDMRCISLSNAASTSAGWWMPKFHLHTRLASHECNIEQACFSPHHRGLLAACDVTGRVMLWNIHATKGYGHLKPIQKRFIHYGHLSPALDVSWSLCEGPPLIATVSEAYVKEKILQQPDILQVWAPNERFF